MRLADVRIGIVGAGYIAGWHSEAVKATRGVRLVAVCDASREAGQALAAALGVPYYQSVADLIAARVADAVLVLTPPASHAAIAIECLNAGLHVLVEKPMALSSQDAANMRAAADAAGRQLAVTHNFLGLPSHTRLKKLLANGDLGRVSSVHVDWALPLAPLRSGPYGVWLAREDRNLLLELGPHAFGFLVHLFGTPEIQSVTLSHPIELPGNGGIRHQGWRILARAGEVDLSITMSMVETVDDRTLTIRGSSGLARLDFAADTLIVHRDNTSELIVSPLRRQLSLAAQHIREGVRNAVKQTVSLNGKSPYGISFRSTIAAFRDAIRTGRPDPRFSAETGVKVVGAIETALGQIPASPPAPDLAPLAKPADVMVIGGTGYIGRALTRALVARGHAVRVLSRSSYGPFADISHMVETVPVSMSDQAGLTEAMRGMKAVYNLARSLEKSWDSALANDVGATLRVAEAARDAGVSHLIYTGTIASYDMSDPNGRITENTGFGPMQERNLYARSKAECERRLIAFAKEANLPLTIARPGIVIGGDGPLQHWGIGRWHGAGAVRFWGSGRNVLPFVLIDDVAEALVRMMEVPAAVGTSFNLTGEPILSGRDYFDGLRSRSDARVHTQAGSLSAMWAADSLKWSLKRYALGKKDAVRPSRVDWQSRGHLAVFDNSHPKAVLGWKPETDRSRFLDRAIDPIKLFGL